MIKFFKSIFARKEKRDLNTQSGILREAMFSSVYELSTNLEEIYLRIHPAKKEPYDAIINNNGSVAQDDNPIFIKDILLLVNKGDNSVEISYSKISKLSNNNVLNITHVKGFDSNGEPIIYEMKDGSIRVVFFEMPPESINSLENFDLDQFSEEFTSSIGNDAWQDDREIFHVPKSSPEIVSQIKQFLENYRN